MLSGCAKQYRHNLRLWGNRGGNNEANIALTSSGPHRFFILVSNFTPCFNGDMKQKPKLNNADIELLKKTFATRQEIQENFATREEIQQSFATKEDLDDAKQEILSSQEKFRSDFFEKIDPILKEVTTNREERTIINHRLEKLENVI